MQYPNVPSHLCHQPAQAPPEAARYVQRVEQQPKMLSVFCILIQQSTHIKHFSHPCLLAVGVGPASVVLGNLVAGKRIAQAAGRDLGMIEDQDLVRKVIHSVLSQNLYLCTTCCKRLVINY